jgi:hypothetical protein
MFFVGSRANLAGKAAFLFQDHVDDIGVNFNAVPSGGVLC